MMTDSISDFLTRIRNGVQARHKKVDVAASKMRISMAEIFKDHGFIRNYKLFRQNQKGVLRIYLKYLERGEPVIHGLQRISKPGRRVYRGHNELPRVLGGIGMALISTPKGVLADAIAREQRVGGEVVCKIW